MEELRFRGRVIVIVCYRFCFYTPTLHQLVSEPGFDPGVKLVSIIYKNSTSKLTEESFMLNNYVICFSLIGLLDLSPELYSKLY